MYHQDQDGGNNVCKAPLILGREWSVRKLFQVQGCSCRVLVFCIILYSMGHTVCFLPIICEAADLEALVASSRCTKGKLLDIGASLQQSFGGKS